MLLTLAIIQNLNQNIYMIERVGIIGGGQLGRMLTVPAKQLGFEVAVVDPTPDCPAWRVGAEQILADPTLRFKDREAILELSRRSDVLTWELEHIPADYLQELSDGGVNVQPDPRGLRVVQDKYEQKMFIAQLGIPTAPLAQAYDFAHGEIDQAMFKARTEGFDGRGNLVASSWEEAKEYFGHRPFFAERMVDFDREVALIMARDTAGNKALYPLVETVHRDSICHVVSSPADVPRRVRARAEEIGHELGSLISGAGVFAIEMFLMGDELMVNEVAPRVHNSGHLTIEANATSQFEQQIRAVTGLPLGSTDMTVPAAVMINLLGTHEGPLDRTGLERALALPGVHGHFYGKSLKPARKVGHLTVVGSTMTDVREIAEQARNELGAI